MMTRHRGTPKRQPCPDRTTLASMSRSSSVGHNRSTTEDRCADLPALAPGHFVRHGIVEWIVRSVAFAHRALKGRQTPAHLHLDHASVADHKTAARRFSCAS